MNQPTHPIEQSRYGIVLVTAGSQTEADQLAEALIAAKLAACVSVLPIRSIYTWNGEVCRESEWQLVIKTDLAFFPALEEKIHQLHSYETPEIIALPIVVGSAAYLNWLSGQLQGS